MKKFKIQFSVWVIILIVTLTSCRSLNGEPNEAQTETKKNIVSDSNQVQNVTNDKTESETKDEANKEIPISAPKDTTSDKPVEEAEEKIVLLSTEEIVQEVLSGKWGNGKARADKLTAAGYDYDKIQAEIKIIVDKERKIQEEKLKLEREKLAKKREKERLEKEILAKIEKEKAAKKAEAAKKLAASKKTAQAKKVTTKKTTTKTKDPNNHGSWSYKDDTVFINDSKGNIKKKSRVGKRFIVIDLSKQKLYMYNNGTKFVETYIISGTTKTPTVKGNFSIKKKETDRFLEGFNTDGTRYKSHVDYWLPFYGSYGIHDASWKSKSSYGKKDYYKLRGSHGCINTPFKAVSKVYENIKVGDPVIVFE